MSFLSVLVLSSLAIALPLTVILFAIALRKNFLVGQSFRLQYAEKINSIRFGEMLKKRGVNLQELLHSDSISNIETQIKNCHGCVSTSKCDRTLNNTSVSEQNLTFCPNHMSIAQKG